MKNKLVLFITGCFALVLSSCLKSDEIVGGMHRRTCGNLRPMDQEELPRSGCSCLDDRARTEGVGSLAHDWRHLHRSLWPPRCDIPRWIAFHAVSPQSPCAPVIRVPCIQVHLHMRRCVHARAGHHLEQSLRHR